MPLSFKKHLSAKTKYKGGKSKNEVGYNGPLHKLSSNENLLGPSPLAVEAIKEHINSINEYPPRTDQMLREALSAFYNGQFSAEQFLTSNSGVSILELIIRGFIEKGDECIFSNPFFGPYKSFPKKLGAVLIDVPLDSEDFSLNVEGILKAITPKTKLLFVTNPNNPTGTYTPKRTIDQLVEGLPDHVLLVYDEVYYHFATAPDYVRAIPYVQAGKNVIGVNSFSKAYGLAGLRVGYGYSTREIASYLHQLRIPFMINSLSTYAAIAALKDTDFINRTKDLIQTEKAYLYKELENLRVKYWPSETNFIMIRTPFHRKELESEMVKYGIMIRPTSHERVADCVRVTIGTHESNVAFINALKIILNK